MTERLGSSDGGRRALMTTEVVGMLEKRLLCVSKIIGYNDYYSCIFMYDAHNCRYRARIHRRTQRKLDVLHYCTGTVVDLPILTAAHLNTMIPLSDF
jgi:hypothetical protein